MKIFANNFSLSLSIQEDQPHFRFVRTPWEEVGAILEMDSSIPDKQLYSDAGEGPAFMEEVFRIHTRPSTASLHATWTLMFDSNETLESFFNGYKANFRSVAAAGGLVLNGNGSLLTIIRDGKLDLPKGKVEKGETLDEAALREVEEETGAKGLSLQGLAEDTFHIYNRKGRWDFKTTVWYWMVVDPERSSVLKPQLEEGITHIEWSDLSALEAGIPQTYPQIMHLIRKAVFESKELLTP